jgi:ABC-type ATPase with predicted acetyltransferase domain
LQNHFSGVAVTTYNISKSFTWQGTISEKNAAVMRMFGLTADRLKENAIRHNCQLEINAGDIVYVTGPSGAGKSVLLRELERVVPTEEKINLDDIDLPVDKTLIECMDGDLMNALKTLSIVGLNDVFCILNSPANLSEGQKYRFRLACAIRSEKKFIFADEFCSNLDRISASVISHNIKKHAGRLGVTFILASCHDDLLADLQPDVLVIKELSGKAEVVYKRNKFLPAQE